MYIFDYVPTALAAASSFTQGWLGSSPQPKTIDYYARNLKTIQTIYNLTVWPNNLPIITQGSKAVPPGLFAQNASGRVAPLGNFTGFEDSVEYFFALALTPREPSYAVFSKATVVEFSSGCPEVAASVAWLETRVDNKGAPNDGQLLSTLKEVAFWRFDDTGAVTAYDAWIPNLADWDFLAEGQQNLTDPATQAKSIQTVCGAIQQLCTGANQQYTDVNQCVSTLASKPFGSFDEVWGDNVVCRNVHVILAFVRPAVHCPHVGPTGAMKCVNEPYNEGYFDDEALFGMPLGTTFICPQKQDCHGGY